MMLRSAILPVRTASKEALHQQDVQDVAAVLLRHIEQPRGLRQRRRKTGHFQELPSNSIDDGR